MKKKNDGKIIYSLNVADVQNVARQELERTLTASELKMIEDKIGDQFDWYELIASVITSNVDQCKSMQKGLI